MAAGQGQARDKTLAGYEFRVLSSEFLNPKAETRNYRLF